MSRRAFHVPSFCLLALLLPACDSNGPSAPSPSGPVPSVLVDVDLGEATVAGTLRIVPGPATVGWRYRIDAIPPAIEGREGLVEGIVAIPYRFDAPGTRSIWVELTGPDGPIVIRKSITVVDPQSDFEVLAGRSVNEIWLTDDPYWGDLYPEGIVMDPAGRWLYAANYRTGELVRIDPTTLAAVDRIRLGPQIEGLTVTPSGGRLFAIHKGAGLSVVDLASLTATRLEGFGGHFIQAVDDSHALIGGYGLERVNVDTRETDRASLPRGGWHFSVFPDGARVVSIVWPRQGDLEGPSLEIFSLPDLDPIHSIPLGELSFHQRVAVDPSGNLVYAVGSEGMEVRFLAIDPTTGNVATSIPVNGRACNGYCVANPVVSFASGRLVAFELNGMVVVVDTALDLPRFRFDPELSFGGDPSPAGVAAHPESDILYVLGAAGRLFKIRLRNP